MNKVHKILMGVLLFAGIFQSCSDDTWDKHYQANQGLVSNQNLWETISAEPELSIFAGLLKTYGYDNMLSQSQSYTVFAPDNAALASLDTSSMSSVGKEFIENHITRFFISASGLETKSVGMLNKKKIELSNQGGAYFFGTSGLKVAGDKVASNGIVHTLVAYEPFFSNIYELLGKIPGLESIRDYVYSYDLIEFDESASVPGNVVNGQLTYLDSVFYNYNPILYRFGHINREDSSYIMLAPNNEGWEEAYNRIKNDYVYYNAKPAIADSLQRYYAGQALIQDLIFSNTIQVSPADSLTSTSRNTFYSPRLQELFEGATEYIASNGTVYVTDRLRYKPYESWQQAIKVEAESSLGRVNTLSTALYVTVNDERISNQWYLRLTPTTSSGNPTVTFEIPRTLSSAYDIYCVFVSNLVRNPNSKDLKPCQVYFTLGYLNEKGAGATSRFPTTGTIQTNPHVVDTVLVASGFKFPVANYGEEEVTATLKVSSNVPQSSTTTLSRELLLDCILLEPSK